MRFAVRHAWLQKHPSPSNAAGDFHWHPADAPAELRNAIADLAMRAGGDAAVWLVDGDTVAWARTFAAVAPADRRRYTGVVMTAAQGAGASSAVPAVLAALRLPPARPYGTDSLRGEAIEPPSTAAPVAAAGRSEAKAAASVAAAGRSEAKAAASMLQPDGAALRAVFGDVASDAPGDVAAVVLDGGRVNVARPLDDALPALVGAMLGWLPAPAQARARSGVFTAGRVDEVATRSAGARALRHYLGRAWFAPAAVLARDPSFARRAWLAAEELAAASQLTLEALFEQLGELGRSWDDAAGLERLLARSATLSAEEIAMCDARAPAPLVAGHVLEAGWLWSRVVHYWGRGLLERGRDRRDADELRARLARLLARRVVMDHLFHLDVPEQHALPRRYLRRLAFESLLPRERVGAMRRELARLVPSLVRDGAMSGRVDGEVSLG